MNVKKNFFMVLLAIVIIITCIAVKCSFVIDDIILPGENVDRTADQIPASVVGHYEMRE